MINQTIDKINKREEEYRRRAALFGSLFVFIAVLGVWSFERGLLNFGSQNPTNISSNSNVQTASVVAPTPLDSSSKVASSVWSELVNTYDDFKESVSDVFVPFITGIEVYERK